MNLAELIHDRKGRNSYEALATKVANRLHANRFQQLATQPIQKFPDPDTMDAIADALGVTWEAVLFACVESLGRKADRYGSRVAQLLPQGVNELPYRQQDHIIDTATVLVETFRSATPAQEASAKIRKAASAAVARKAMAATKTDAN